MKSYNYFYLLMKLHSIISMMFIFILTKTNLFKYNYFFSIFENLITDILIKNVLILKFTLIETVNSYP